jgi:alkylhydroperoxidase family enzyme
MQKRLNIKEVAPNALKAMIGLETFLFNFLTIQTKNLFIRASKVNGCAYCINIHTL